MEYPDMKLLLGDSGIDYIAKLSTDGKLEPMLAPVKAQLLRKIGATSHNRLTYKQLVKLQKLMLKHFNYVSDGYQFDEDDMWDTTAWIKWMFAYAQNDKFSDDCDGFGYAVLGVLYYVFGYSKAEINRVACRTEPPSSDGHFVVWVEAYDNNIYQMENRVKQPRSVKYMRDKGYEYWHYNSMVQTKEWYGAEKKASEIVYNTPNDLESDKPSFSLSKALRVDKSHSLLKEWVTVATGAITTVSSVVTHSGSDIVNTLQANQANLAQFLSPTILGMVMVVLGLLGVVLRTVTFKDIDMKRGYDG